MEKEKCFIVNEDGRWKRNWGGTSWGFDLRLNEIENLEL